MSQKSYQKPSYTKPTRKRRHYHYDEPVENEESDSYVTKIRRCPKKQKKRVIYERKQLEFLNMSLICQPKNNKKKTINIRFKVNIEKNNLIKQKNQKKFKKGVTTTIKM